MFERISEARANMIIQKLRTIKNATILNLCTHEITKAVNKLVNMIFFLYVNNLGNTSPSSI